MRTTAPHVVEVSSITMADGDKVERRFAVEQQRQFSRLKDEARAAYGMVDG